MRSKQQRFSATSSGQAIAAIGAVFVLALLGTMPAQAQTFQVIHNFSGGSGGANPLGRLSMDRGGNLYGATYSGGVQQDSGYGIVFKMSPHGSNWTFIPIYAFSASGPGGDPDAGVLFGPGSLLYGTTSNGGTVFTLQPSPTFPPSLLSPWRINWLYSFPLNKDVPAGDVIFDSAGNIYGVTVTGGSNGCFDNQGCGMVYELTPSGGVWALSILYVFLGGADGQYPTGITFDSAGDLIGTTVNGGAHDVGVIFKLTPSSNSWTESVLYNFDCNGTGGCSPLAGLVSDAAGNFYGSTGSQYGTIFEFSPLNGGWAYTVLAQIPPQYEVGPSTPLTLDTAGNLYGTLGSRDTNRPGAVFEVTHGSGGWTFTSLHDFNGGSDGQAPSSTVAIGADGKLYGTAIYGGTCGGNGCGTVWEITP